MTDLLKELEELGFEKKGNIILGEGRDPLKFNLNGDIDQCGQVYIWISEEKNQKPKVLYIGMASYGIDGRFDQHRNGFRGNHTRGATLSQPLIEILKREGNISIYARRSHTGTFFGKQGVPLCWVEELALIARYYRDYELLNKISKNFRKILDNIK